jgi:hypothetical protein
MATLTDIINGALYKLGAIPEGQAASSFQAARGLEFLQDYLYSLPLVGYGGRLDEESVTESLTVDVPVRLLVSASSAITVTLPKNPYNGYTVEIIDVEDNFATYNVTLARNGRKIAGSAANATLSSDGAAVRYVYRADLGDWLLWDDSLSASDSVPLPAAFDESLKSVLAFELASVLGIDLSEPARASIPGKADIASRRIAAAFGPKRRLRADAGLLNLPSRAGRGNTSVYRN